MKEILDVIHKTIYQFFDACEDDKEVPMSDKDKLLLKVNKAICNNLNALEQEPCEDCISRQELLDAIFQKEYGHDYDENADFLGLKYVDIIKGMPSVEPEKCGDCVDRNTLLSKATVLSDIDSDMNIVNHEVVYVKDIKELPSVEPEQKTGHWEYTQDDYDSNVGNWHCSECKDIVVKCLNRVAEGRIPKYKYCSNCGARLVKPQEGEDKT